MFVPTFHMCPAPHVLMPVCIEIYIWMCMMKCDAKFGMEGLAAVVICVVDELKSAHSVGVIHYVVF
jgi:hypothetical protein